MLAIARALMSRPRLLLLDEPSLGLAPLIVKQIFDAIRDLNQHEGLTVFLVEQNAFHALKLAHRGYVMVNGAITMSGTGEELLAKPEVRAAYLEGGPSLMRRHRSTPTRPTRLLDVPRPHRRCSAARWRWRDRAGHRRDLAALPQRARSTCSSWPPAVRFCITPCSARACCDPVLYVVDAAHRDARARRSAIARMRAEQMVDAIFAGSTRQSGPLGVAAAGAGLTALPIGSSREALSAFQRDNCARKRAMILGAAGYLVVRVGTIRYCPMGSYHEEICG